MPSALLDELRWAFRYVRRRPVFAAVVSLTLAVSIAAATTAFGLATAVLWRALPFHDASRLVFVWEEVERDGQREPARVTGARYAAWRDSSDAFDAIALFGAGGFTMEGASGATSVRGVRVSANYFNTLGIRPILGRAFLPADEEPGNHRVVVLSHAFWQERFGGRRDAIGGTLRLSGQPYTVLGVMPPVTFPAWPVNPATVTLDPDARQLWVPIARTPALDRSGGAHVFGVVARLAPGVSAVQATGQLNRATDATALDPHGARLSPLREQFVRDARTPLLALASAALAVLLIACANLAALYLSAFESRRGELAVRAAIGAGVARLVRQLAFEALLLAFAGAAGGLVMAGVALALVPDFLPPSIPFLTVPAIDAAVVAFAVGLALLASLMLTAWPITRLVTWEPSPRGVASRPRGRVYQTLVVSQIAVTLALVAAAALLTQSLQSVQRQHPGFAIDRMFVAEVGMASGAPLSASDVARGEQELLAALASLPGVQSVATAYDHPLEANWSENPTIVGDAATPEGQQRQAELRIVSPGYFEALGVELLDGRTLTERDALDAPGVALVNEAYARAIGGQVLGRTLRSGTPRFLYGDVAPHEFEIVGVVDNERVRGLEQGPQPAFYLTTRQFPQTDVALLVRTTADPQSMASTIRTAIRLHDAAITVSRPTSLEAILAEQLVSRRVTTEVIGGLAAAALALAALGMYALLAVLVGSRTREIGVRLAIGASPRSVAWRIIVDSLTSAAAGVASGCVLALAAGRLLQGLLVDVSPRDPLTLAMVSAVLLMVATGAALIPARRAARIDPVEALRTE